MFILLLGGNMIKKIDKSSFIIAFIIWCIVNISGIQKLYFNTDITLKSSIIKVMHLFFLWFIVCVFKKIYINRRKNEVKNGIIIGLIYFIITFSILLLVWPGMWSWDDIHVVTYARYYGFVSWQHFFSSIFHILCLQTLPFATGVIIMQILFASMIVGYCVSAISNLLAKRTKNKIIMEILLTAITLLPPVLEYILSGFRMGIYSYIELLLIVILYTSYSKKEKFTLNKLITVTILTIIVASWRTEGIYYLACVPILLLFIIRKNTITYKPYWTYVCVIFSIISIIAIGKYNNYLTGNSNYSITATISPVSELVKKADVNKDKNALENINKLIDINLIYENPELPGEGYFWMGIVRGDYTSDDYTSYLKGYMNLALKYPKVTFNTMWDMFVKTSGVDVKKDITLQRTTVNATTGGTLQLFENENWMKNNVVSKLAINKDIRESAIQWLACIDEEGKVTSFYYIFWNLFIPLSLVILCLIYKLIKREWFIVILVVTVLFRVLLVFLTSPSPYIMYYLSVYLISYFMSVMIIVQIFNNVKFKFKFRNN